MMVTIPSRCNELFPMCHLKVQRTIVSTFRNQKCLTFANLFFEVITLPNTFRYWESYLVGVLANVKLFGLTPCWRSSITDNAQQLICRDRIQYYVNIVCMNISKHISRKSMTGILSDTDINKSVNVDIGKNGNFVS